MSPTHLLRRNFLTTTTRTIPRYTSYQPPIYRSTPSSFFSTTTVKMAGGKVVKINSKAEFTEALQAGGLMVLDCAATWCGPCKMMSPKVAEFSTKYTNARFYEMDVDEQQELAAELGIKAMPTFLFFKDGEKINSVVGANPVGLESAIQANV